MNKVINYFDKIAEYHKILSPEYPDFLDKYIQTRLLQRLKGVGLLCGTDWTPLYKNRFFYSRLDHSIGVALIIWRFTKSKKQTIAGLLHDVSTPAFSHVADFRNGDAMTQTTSEKENDYMVRNDVDLGLILNNDGLYSTEVGNYHRYPIADNDIPRLSSDRLEYMFPSGMALDGTWDMESIARVYGDITLVLNEDEQAELGFCSKETAEEYCKNFCHTAKLLQRNENKLALQLLAEICTLAVNEEIVSERDFMALSEEDIMKRFEEAANNEKRETRFASYFRTFTTMTSIEHSDKPLDGYFNIKLDVKRRYIDPLVATKGTKGVRISELSKEAAEYIQEALNYQDSTYGCAKLL